MNAIVSLYILRHISH